ncbi:MAG: hypothetical protein H6835_09460 [Planctomycetes bacterium]|nr:hypothetical protein [Planctomycetota bacterium]
MNATSVTRRLAALALLTAPLAAQDRPHVVGLDPPDCAAELDPAATTHLTVTFDRDMDTAGHGVGGERALWPAVSATQWLDRRTFRLQVGLEADRIYALDLSRGAPRFVDAEGVGAMPTSWRFATRGEPLPEGTVAAALERLRTALREHYSRRDSRGVDWDRAIADHLEQVTSSRSGPALALALTDVLGQGQDVDVDVVWGRTTIPTSAPAEPANFALPGLQLRLAQLQRVERVGRMARTEDRIGYLQIDSFALQRRELDQLLQALRSLNDCKALVLDVRTCHAGDEDAARRIAAFFVAGEHTYAMHRERDVTAEGGFRDVVPHTMRGNDGRDVFDGPVAVLTGPGVRDAGELFLMMMQRARDAVLVGARSYGSVGAPQLHQLAPGLSVRLPHWLLLRANGATFDGEGVEPNLVVASTPEQHLAGDPVLDAALTRLRGER